MFIAYNKVRMHDTDMAGRLYFARQFRFAHDALEDLVEAEGFCFDKVFHEEKFAFVIVHCEADYLAPLRVGDKLEVHVFIDRIGNTSFTVSYHFYKNDHLLIGTAKTIHVTIDIQTQSKIEIPSKFRTVLEKYFISNDPSQ